MGQRQASSSFENDDSSSLSDRISDYGDCDIVEDEKSVNFFCIGLLGTGESGKTTLVKNFKSVLNDYFLSKDDLYELRRKLYFMMRESINSLLDLEMDFQLYADSDKDYNYIKKFIPNFETPNIQRAYKNRHLYQFPLENFESLLNKIDAIQNLQMGLQEDLESYWLTTGIPEYRIKSNITHCPVIILDSEGQRCGRKKWKFVFEHKLGCLIYVISLSEFNQICREDDNLNRLQDSLSCFAKTVCDKDFPSGLPFYILFNKVDLLEKKISEGFNVEGFEQVKLFVRFGKSIETLENNERISLKNLNEDTLSEIFKFLNPADLFSVMISNRQFNRAANRDCVWYTLCKYHHPDINYRNAMKVFEEMTQNQLDSIDEENSLFKMYYKNRGWIVQKTIQHIQHLYLSRVPSSISYKSFVTNVTDSEDTKQVILRILRNEKIIS